MQCFWAGFLACVFVLCFCLVFLGCVLECVFVAENPARKIRHWGGREYTLIAKCLMFLVSFFGLCFWVVILGAVFLCCVVELCFRVVFVCCVFGLFWGAVCLGYVFGLCLCPVSARKSRHWGGRVYALIVKWLLFLGCVFGLCFWAVFLCCVLFKLVC
jgi:hypothetical protein